MESIHFIVITEKCNLLKCSHISRRIPFSKTRMNDFRRMSYNFILFFSTTKTNNHQIAQI